MMRLIILGLLLLMSIPTRTQAAEPFAVIELFGSEGCSSCPPADELLRGVTQMAREKGYRIFTLSFHVDYWNYIGWVDPFSKKEFTKRQEQYSAILPGASMYTPQMIVNGVSEFVGSDSDRARDEVEKALQTVALNSIVLKVKKTNAGTVEVVYNCEQLVGNAVLNFALVERGLESHVTRGENAGEVLKHDNVVRSFKTIEFTQNEGEVSFSRPASDDLSRFSVVGFIQDKTTMKITAAQSVDLQ